MYMLRLFIIAGFLIGCYFRTVNIQELGLYYYYYYYLRVCTEKFSH